MKVLGIHHITLITQNAQRNVNFYVRVLGQRLIKQTINFDDPGSYHLYFGDATGQLGSVISFFEWRHAQRGKPGIGGTHHFALRVTDYDGLLKWKRRLIDLGIRVYGPYDRHYFHSIYFKDPDGVVVEIATDGPGFTVDEAPDALGLLHRPPPAEIIQANRDEAAIRAAMWPEPVPEITSDMALSLGIHHITAITEDIARTQAFFGDLLGMQRLKMTKIFEDATSAHWYWGLDGGQPGTIVTYFERDPQQVSRAQMGAGQTHHFALAVRDEEELHAWRERLQQAGHRVSEIMDRKYFKSISTTDPDGHIVELATMGPGFLVDEDEASMGTSLKLPSWLERQRELVEICLIPLTLPVWPGVKREK